MPSPSTYLDFAATAPLRPEAFEAITAALSIGANPSSVHAGGRAARAVIERAREHVAALAGAPTEAVVFTSGATEANALAIASAAHAGCRLIVGAIEHDSVVQAALATGRPVERIPVGRDGVYDLDWLEARLADGGARPFVAVMAANNETGILQPVAAAARLSRAVGGWLHVDAVQTAGRRPLAFTASGADSMALTAHKLGGPQGVGALVWGPGAPLRANLTGGGQERGLRAGTENVAGVAGFGAAARVAGQHLEARLPGMARASARVAEARLRDAGATVVGAGVDRLDDFLCVATPGWRSDLQVVALDLEGVRVSAGAACSSGKVAASRVLAAMGLEGLAACGLRASGGWSATPRDWDRFADVWLAARSRRSQRLSAKEFA